MACVLTDVNEGFNVIRVPIWGMHAHWTEGSVDGRYYHSQVTNWNNWPSEEVTFDVGANGGGAIESVINAQAANPSTVVMMSLKLNPGSNGAAWPPYCVTPETFQNDRVKSVVIPKAYGKLLVEYMQYLKDAGVKTDGWMLSPNTEMPPYTGPIHLQAIRNMSAMADNHFSYINMPFSEYFAQYYKVLCAHCSALTA
eukprot:6086599-Prymnesium_polylepis.3